jgi:colanic acid/amylovoran biosynthesis glycosyltransferase
MTIDRFRRLIRTAREDRLTTHRLSDSTDESEVARLHESHLTRLGIERFAHGVLGRPRIMATACWNFPIWSQTFVYQELSQLMANGFALRFLYWEQKPQEYIPSQFSKLWHARRPLLPRWTVWQRDYAHYAERMPEKIEALVDMLCQASGMTSQELRSNNHFFQAFSFTRMVEAYRPAYLHSYFFYEGTLFTFVASYLLNIPRGVSCYADHMMKDYAFKLIPLHLKQCSLVVATSHRIKQELLSLAPDADPDRILVKPNAVDVRHFPPVSPGEPEQGQPYRLVCVSRIEPKKGLQYLVEAIRILRDRQIPVEAHLLGGVDDNPNSQEYARSLNAQIDDLKLQGIVHLEGRKTHDEIKQYFAKAHLFTAPFVETDYGDKDGIPTALLEAMAAGLPVVATDAGSILEVVENGRDGIVVPQRDPMALANAIETLLRNPAHRRQLGKEATSTVGRRFDVQVCERSFHKRIHAVMRAPRSSA